MCQHNMHYAGRYQWCFSPFRHFLGTDYNHVDVPRPLYLRTGTCPIVVSLGIPKSLHERPVPTAAPTLSISGRG